MSLEKGKIYLFDPAINSFKNYLKFLKVHEKDHKVVKFSHVSEEGTFVPNLSLKENIFLDSIPHTLTTSKEFQFEKYIRDNKNEHTLDLLKKVDSLEKMPNAVTKENRKICALFKALLQDHEFLFLESPLKFLQEETRELVIKVFLTELQSKNRIIFLATTSHKDWAPYINYNVSYSHESQLYAINNSSPTPESWKDRISDGLIKRAS